MTDLFDTVPADAFDSPTEREPGDFLRTGRWGRPRVRPATRGVDGEWVSDVVTKKTVDYPRVTTIADQLTGGPGLTAWKVEHTALAVARASRGTRLALAAKEYGDPFVKLFIEKALEQAIHNEKADLGTAVGRLIEPGAPRDILDPEDDADLIADIVGFDEAMVRHGLEICDTQILCVQDDLKVAGTADILFRCPDPCVVTFKGTGRTVDLSGRVVVGDNKRAKSKHPVGWALQVAMYAKSRRYDEETEERSELHPDLDSTVGIISWVQPATGHTQMILIDLEVGWQCAQLAKLLHSQGADGRHLTATMPTFEDPTLARIRNADGPELRAVWGGMSSDDERARYFEPVQERIRELQS